MALATGSAMGLWEVKNCTSFRARYICRQSLGTPVTPELPGPDPTPSLTGSCPQGWVSDPKLRHCYKVGYPIGVLGVEEQRENGSGEEVHKGDLGTVMTLKCQPRRQTRVFADEEFVWSVPRLDV